MLSKLLSSDAYTPVNKYLAKQLWFVCAWYFGELIRQRERFWQNEFFFSQTQMENELWISEYEQRQCVKMLVLKWFITLKKKWMPAKYHFIIDDFSVLENLKDKSLKIWTTSPTEFEGHSNNILVINNNKEIISKDITKSKDFDTKKRVDIDLLINDIKWLCNELWVAYNKDKDRMFWKHIIEWVEFGKFCEDIWQTRIEFAKNVLKASLKINYWKWVCSWPKLIYQNYSDVYNQTKLKNKKTTEQSRVAFIPWLWD